MSGRKPLAIKYDTKYSCKWKNNTELDGTGARLLLETLSMNGTELSNPLVSQEYDQT